MTYSLRRTANVQINYSKMESSKIRTSCGRGKKSINNVQHGQLNLISINNAINIININNIKTKQI